MRCLNRCLSMACVVNGDIFYLQNVYVNNFIFYFHSYNWLNAERMGGEKPPRRDGYCSVLGHHTSR